ncbi:disease resistance protein Pikm1-TS isoform X1 [Triticum aestivum]|uniref:disease resistance protein Pikm1-TS isoform X1 n=1 Tax=Triticum aestivum TaxID=4565 RepID=UPI001D00815D|nr:disease resistance protein Pikm1-TS-like isoform X1 [Triticum aestivum]
MAALTLSYDHLPFDQQQCFTYCGLFPEDFHFSSSQLMNLWIGLDILQCAGGNQTLEDVGLRNINDLVMHGFFKEKETDGRLYFVMDDLLHDLALKVASHECLTLHLSNAGSLYIPSGIRHLSIIIDDGNAMSAEKFKTELREPEMRMDVRHLQTLILFGEMDESCAKILGDLFSDASALRVLHLHETSYLAESILHNFSSFDQLRYLFIGTKVRGLMHRYSVLFKRLKCVRVLDLHGCKDLDNSAMVDICLMIKLKYLSLKQTQVTEIPPEISNLQKLETLDVSQTQISNIPPEIRKLQELKSLDIRQTQVKEIPKEVLQLPKLIHLHFGQSGSFGVKLPAGINQLESVQVMGTVDSRECSESAIKEISELTELRELEVVLYDKPEDMERNDKLLSSVGKSSNLKSLTIYGDSNPSDKLPSEYPNFPQLEKLKVAGRFVKVPGWIGQLSTLSTLVIRVCKVEANDLTIIGGLPCLRVLALELVAVPRKQVTITSSAGFARLEVFCFDCRVPWVSFQEKAMPNLKHLQLQLYRGPADKVPSGIMLLELLNTVILLYSSKYAASDSVFEAVAVVRENAASHANLIELSINGDTETFPSNIGADRCVAGTEFVNAGSEIEEV